MNGTKADIYLRLSKEQEDGEKSNSITNQRAITRDFAKGHDIEIIDEYVDDGHTGTNFDRAGVKRLFEDAKNGRI